VGEVAHIVRNLANLAKRIGKDNMIVALSYVLSNAAVATALVGVSTKLQLDELIKAKAQMIKLSDSDKQVLLEGVRSLYYTEHR
jgi:aryl-alcohol dehydrogenase-like predicted oxidoreductase